MELRYPNKLICCGIKTILINKQKKAQAKVNCRKMTMY